MLQTQFQTVIARLDRATQYSRALMSRCAQNDCSGIPGPRLRGDDRGVRFRGDDTGGMLLENHRTYRHP
jgi:hypothetical protein